MRRGSRGSGGFTLIEMLVALVVTGLTLLLAYQIFGATADAGRQLEGARAALNREQNAHRWLTTVFLDLDVGSAPDVGFEGSPERVAFGSWLPTAFGWDERSPVVLEWSEGRLIARGRSRTLVLADSVVAVGFDYLLEPGANTRWVGSWSSPVSAPLAVRVRVTHLDGHSHIEVDTTLYLIKSRG